MSRRNNFQMQAPPPMPDAKTGGAWMRSYPAVLPGPAPDDAPEYIPNPANLILQQKHKGMRFAVRYALSTACDPATKEPVLTKAALRSQLKTIQIKVAGIGAHPLIPSGAGVKQIFEMFIWNVTGQTLSFSQGNGVPWFDLTDFPDATGLTLGFNGSFEQPHFEVDNNQSLILTCQNATAVDGFIRYRIQNGSY